MTEQATVLQFPTFLHGPFTTVQRKATEEGKRWARQYVKQGTFSPPRQMRELASGEPVATHTLGDFPKESPAWRVYLLLKAIGGVGEGADESVWKSRTEAFEAFCLGTPWGALYHVVQPWYAWDASRMAARLAAVLRFWDVLQIPRYLHWSPNRLYTLDELMKDIYGRTLTAWCPEGADSVREHMRASSERMGRATRADCIEAVLRVIPQLDSSKLKHRETLGNPALLRERLDALPPERFARLSGAYAFEVYDQLVAWDRELEEP